MAYARSTASSDPTSRPAERERSSRQTACGAAIGGAAIGRAGAALAAAVERGKLRVRPWPAVAAATTSKGGRPLDARCSPPRRAPGLPDLWPGEE
jgi:hypothetical protein